MLLAHLLVMHELYMDLFSWKEDQLVTDWNRKNRDLPETSKKLAKCLTNTVILADEWCAGTDRKYPNFDHIKLLPKMRELSVKNHHKNEMDDKIHTCTLWHASEVALRRYTAPDFLSVIDSFQNLDKIARAFDNHLR